MAPEPALLPQMLRGFLKGFFNPNPRIEIHVIHLDIFFCFTKE